ncbi:MAG: heptaprenyl diphosphate synthase component 1 [Bacillota bacterium]|nr:heptaprenyl diphosphate synthase component 1 [Bacillota bacterium]
MIKLRVDIRQKLSEMKELVERRVFHPYLLKFIQTPYIDEDKLLILLSILDLPELSCSQIQNYALTAMLIQIALDTHENVSNAPFFEEKKESQTTRQLTVLAGDYYSGLYYMLLAESADIPMIKALANGIKEVNEHKISVFQKEFDSIENLMTSIKMIESSLLKKILDYFQVSAWDELITNILFVNRLLKEKAEFARSGRSMLIDALKYVTFPKCDDRENDLSNEQYSYLLIVCDRYIEYSKKLIENSLKMVPHVNDFLKERILSILNSHQPIVNTFVEEG